MPGPAFHRIEEEKCRDVTPCFPGAHSGLLDLAASLLAEMNPEDCSSSQNDIVSKIATHLRHCIKTYQAFFDGLPSRRIDYAGGGIHTPENHTCNDVFDQVLRIHTRMVQEAAPLPPCTRLLIRHGEEWLESSLARESAYLEEHALHHCADVAMMMQQIPVERIKSSSVAFTVNTFGSGNHC